MLKKCQFTVYEEISQGKTKVARNEKEWQRILRDNFMNIDDDNLCIFYTSKVEINKHYFACLQIKKNIYFVN